MPSAASAGSVCSNKDAGEHLIVRPEDDRELQKVLNELSVFDLELKFRNSIQRSIDYILDGAKTGRFRLYDPEVDSGERAAVGTKLEYELIGEFSWTKEKPLDIVIADVPVDIKATVGRNWSIPKEAHCQLCICVRIDAKAYRHQSWLMRTHRSLLYKGKGNGDGKRGIVVDALNTYGVSLYGEGQLPVNPLTLLSERDRAVVFAPRVGQEKRLTHLFMTLPGVVIPRSSILTVCAGNDDPMRRARALKNRFAAMGWKLLCGKWDEERAEAAALGYDLSGAAWVAIKNAPDVADN